MKRPEYYGKLGLAELPCEIRQIWYSRNDELGQCPRPTIAPLVELSEFEVLTAKDYAHKLIEITPLTQREEIIVAMYICAGFSLEEVAQVMDLTRESVRKIVIKILQKFRKAASELGEEWRDD